MFLDDLPTASRYIEAKRNDPDYVEAMVKRLAKEDLGEAEPGRRWTPRSAEWDTQHELMASFYDRLGNWLVQYANSNRPKGKPPMKQLPPFPRPVTAVDKARAQLDVRAEQKLDDLIADAHATYAADHPDEQAESGGET